MLKEKLNIAAELTKVRITLFVALTTAFGYICFAGEFTLNIILPVIGVFLLASGSSVLNHLQERYTDAKMERTKNRPIPSGKITANSALLMSVILVFSGSAALYFSSGNAAFLLGLLNLVWYNLIYTPLKKVTPLAIFPGSLVGAIPPVIGWVAAGGYVFDPQVIILAFFFFIWQIPHFWLLLLVLDKDYEKAGFPTLTQVFSHEQLARITFVWIIATVVTGLIMPIFGIVNSAYINLSLIIAGIWLAYNSFRLLKPIKEKVYFRFAFREINIFAVVLMILLSLDKLIFIK